MNLNANRLLPSTALFLGVLMVGFACLVSQFIGWQYPLTTTAGAYLNPTVGFAFVIVAETAWLSTNLFTIRLLKKCWKSPPGFTLTLVAIMVSISIPTQVFLGHCAIRSLRDFAETMPL